MGFSRRFFKEHNFMLTKIFGEINDQDLKQHVIELNTETKGIIDFRELADCRNLEDIKLLTTQGTSNCGDLENDRPESLLAILITDSILLFGMARAYQIFAANRRKEVEIFKDPKEALTWLSNSEEEIKILNNLMKSA